MVTPLDHIEPLVQRSVLVLCCSLLALVLLPGIASAHASFDLGQVPAESEQTVTLRVPIERDAGNDRIAMRVPAGFAVPSCDGAEGWTCTTDALDDGTVVQLTRQDDGDPAIDRFEVTLTAPSEEGVYPFPVVQTYDDGEEVAWVNEEGSDRPAPRLQVGDSTTEVEPAEAPTHDSADDATAAPTTSPSSEPDEAPSVDRTVTPTPTEDDAPTADDAEDGTGDADDEVAADEVDAPTEDGAEDDSDNGLLLVLLGTGVALAVVAGVAMRQRSDDA